MGRTALAIVSLSAFALGGCTALGLTCENGWWDDCDGAAIEDAYWDTKSEVSQFNTAIANVPTDGTATYDGYAQMVPYYGAIQGKRVHSEVHLDVNFDTSSASGTMTNFYTLARRVNGSVTIENGAISGNQVTADLSGSVYGNTFIGANTGSATVDGSLSGRFRGDSAEGLYLGVNIDLTYADGVYGSMDGGAYLLNTTSTP